MGQNERAAGKHGQRRSSAKPFMRHSPAPSSIDVNSPNGASSPNASSSGDVRMSTHAIR
ncbi:MAG: hypothetical protein R2854_10425 [Caldilineaceae bacterium]